MYVYTDNSHIESERDTDLNTCDKHIYIYNIYIYMSVCVYIYMYMYIYMCVCIYIYMQVCAICYPNSEQQNQHIHFTGEFILVCSIYVQPPAPSGP